MNIITPNLLRIPATLFFVVTCFQTYSLTPHLQAQSSQATPTPAETPKSDWRTRAEARFKAIYDRGEFRAKGFRPAWLTDSSGFVVDGVAQEADRPVQWHYDAATGERRLHESDNASPIVAEETGRLHGQLRLDARGNQLVVVDQKTQQETVLMSGAEDRDIEYRDPIWSPDGTRILFIEADFTDVRQRWVLVPGDPSFPEVQQNRFARVGETIEKLRVGVVDADGQNQKWLPIECPQEGMYLGQVEWAGSSDEVLVEKFSRFRDRRDFLLVSMNGSVTTMYSETDHAWVEASQGWNSGLVWIKRGQEFVVISEQDG